MDFGVLGLHGLLSSNTSTSTADAPNGFASSHLESKHKRYGSGFLKQERSGPSEDDWRSSKLSKTEPMLPQQKTTLDPSSKSLSFSCIDNENKEPQMLSFSLEGSTQNATLFPCFHFPSPALSSRSSGYSFGIYGGGRSMQLGVFTESQWMELEHQALIYKYITANVPVPNHLLVSIRKAMESARLYCFPGSLLRPNTLGWEAFHLGFSGNTDPEPGRCRRTDGKKWRCSRDVVADQKYCERHINRGRHRSRKPVEGQLGHSSAASTTTTANIPKGFLATSANAVASTVVGSQGSSVLSSFPVSQQQQQLVNFSPACSHNLSTSSLSRTFLDKGNMVSADSIFNPLHKNSSFITGGSFGTEQGLTCGENVMQHSLPPFMDDWPNKSQSDTSAASWPKFDRQLDKTQLSISIPMATADYMSTTSSPNNDRMILSPPRLKGKFDPVHMGLGVGSVLNEPNEKHANWIPKSWETSVGGPLGEVLNRTNKISSGKCKDSSALNLMTKGWASSPSFGSPTGVLPKTTFDSLLTSSIGSSPRADNKTSESVSVGNALVQF